MYMYFNIAPNHFQTNAVYLLLAKKKQKKNADSDRWYIYYCKNKIPNVAPLLKVVNGQGNILGALDFNAQCTEYGLHVFMLAHRKHDWLLRHPLCPSSHAPPSVWEPEYLSIAFYYEQIPMALPFAPWGKRGEAAVTQVNETSWEPRDCWNGYTPRDWFILFNIFPPLQNK